MNILNKLNECIDFWINEFGLMNLLPEELQMIERRKGYNEYKNFCLDGEDLDIINCTILEGVKDHEKFIFPIFVVINNKDDLKKDKDKFDIFEEIKKSIDKTVGLKEGLANKSKIEFDYRIVVISKNPELSIQIQNRFNKKADPDFKNKDAEIKQVIKAINNWKRVRKVDYIFSSYPSVDLRNKKHILTTEDINSLYFKREYTKDKSSESIIPLEGRVFSVKLFDLVELYNMIGEDLFLKNVRLGIRDVLDVNYSIRKTLVENPEDFWFLNNGITLYAPKGAINFLNYSYIDIVEKLNDISIVNGAQTITSAAKFFYDDFLLNSGKEESRKVEIAKNNAYVMLKIIEIDEDINNGKETDNINSKSLLEEKIKERINEVTISLNRQKPIGQVDIAYTNREIYDINDFYIENITNEKVNDYIFKIIRRGEISSIPNHQYFLDEVARVLVATK